MMRNPRPRTLAAWALAVAMVAAGYAAALAQAAVNAPNAAIGGGGSGSCNTQVGYSPFKYGPDVPGMQWFTRAKLGMFMHYGPVSQWGTEISFPLVCGRLPCTVRGPGNKPLVINTAAELEAHRRAYAALQHTFNPTAFDADAMAQLAKDAGFEYLMWVIVMHGRELAGDAVGWAGRRDMW